MWFSTVFLLFCAGFSNAVERFDDFKVYRLNPKTEEQIQFVASLESEHNLDFWKGVNNVNIPVDVMVAPKDQKFFIERIENEGIPFDVMIGNVQGLIPQNDVANYAGRMTWTSYHRLQDIYNWFNDLVRLYPSKVSLIHTGKTYLKRDINGVKISFGPGRRAVFIEGGIHAREWISPATVTYIINELLTTKDSTLIKIARSFDWYIVPVTNPDGYEYTYTNNRLWRKTRTPYGSCFGADPNRNWNYRWMEQGASNDTCDDAYAGPKPFSESEAFNSSTFISSIGNQLDVYLSFHSYSQMLLLPYGHTTAHLDNYDDVMKIGRAAIKSLATRYNTTYVVGNIAETIYFVTGTSVDWVKYNYLRKKIVLAYELRDTGDFGFLLPSSQIIPNCLEVMDSIKTIFTEGEKLKYFKLK